MPETPFKFFSRNTQGRDFVVGDIHGHFSALELLLVKVGFQPAHDRLFSVGDMIDRGPESWRVVEFLNYPWFHAILGNHEQMLIDAAINPSVDKNWITHNGGDWWQAIPEQYRPRIRQLIKNLPFAFEVLTRHGRIGIVHADIAPGMTWREFVRSLNTDSEVRECALWSRHRFKYIQMASQVRGIDGIDWVVFGHTPVSRPLRYSNTFYIDTGATYIDDTTLGHLTLLEIQPTLKLHQWCVRTKQFIPNSKWQEHETVPA